MGIDRIRVNNFKSLKKVYMDFSEEGVTCLLGKNGSGKSSVIKAITYFYAAANNTNIDNQIIDNKNPFIQKASIEIQFDVSLQTKSDRFSEIKDVFNDYITLDNKLSIEMNQYKNGMIEWKPVNNPFVVKKLLSCFPIYFIDAKKITSDSWDCIWSIVSEIAISMCEEDDKTRTKIIDVFKEIYGDRFFKTYEKILKVLKTEKIDIKQNDYMSKYKNALIVSLGGDQFTYDDERFNYYSYGVNSLKFLCLYISLLIELTDVSYKEAFLLIDEPEISMHPPYIDKLASYFVCKHKMQYMLVTHSPHLLANLLNYNSRTIFYKIYNSEGYSNVERYRLPESSVKWPIGDDETVPFFSNAVVFVEGTSEMQLFCNKDLKKIFPILENISLFSTDSNDSSTKAVLSKGKNRAIPYLVIIDMDKILSYSSKKQRFKVNRKNITVNPLGSDEILNKENLYYPSQYRKNTHNVRLAIEQLLKNNFSVSKNDFDIQDNVYNRLIDMIQAYCRHYQVFPLRTTIEGMLICEKSYDCFKGWLRNRDSAKYSELIEIIDDYPKSKAINVLRCIFLGKLDTLKNPIEGKEQYVADDILELINKYKISSKTSWINDYISWIINDWLCNLENDEKKRMFCELIPEFKSVVINIENMIKYRKYE